MGRRHLREEAEPGRGRLGTSGEESSGCQGPEVGKGPWGLELGAQGQGVGVKVPEEGDPLTQSAQDSDSWLRGSRALCAWCLLGLQKRLVWPVHILVATLQEAWGCCSLVQCKAIE